MKRHTSLTEFIWSSLSMLAICTGVVLVMFATAPR